MQTIFYDSHICGRRGGLPFANVTRPDASNNCPSGTVPCSTVTTAENTVCYPSSEVPQNCPVTELKAVKSTESASDTYLDYGKAAIAGTNYVLVFGKNADSLPLTTFDVEYKPCAKPSETSVAPGTTFYPLEIVPPQCSEDVSSGFTFDKRFTPLGL